MNTKIVKSVRTNKTINNVIGVLVHAGGKYLMSAINLSLFTFYFLRPLKVAYNG